MAGIRRKFREAISAKARVCLTSVPGPQARGTRIAHASFTSLIRTWELACWSSLRSRQGRSLPIFLLATRPTTLRPSPVLWRILEHATASGPCLWNYWRELRRCRQSLTKTRTFPVRRRVTNDPTPRHCRVRATALVAVRRRASAVLGTRRSKQLMPNLALSRKRSETQARTTYEAGRIKDHFTAAASKTEHRTGKFQAMG